MRKDGKISYIFYLTEYCNLACKYCYQGEKKQERFMSPEVGLSRLNDVMKIEHDPFIVLFGGEPLLNWKTLIAILDKANEYRNLGKKIRISLVTNATLLSLEKLRKLFEYSSFLNLEISIDGSKRTHNECRIDKRGNGTFDAVYNNAKRALLYFPFSYARIVVVDINSYKDNVLFLKEMGFRCFRLQGLHGNFNEKHIVDNKYQKYFYKITIELINIIQQTPFSQVIYYPLEKKDNNGRKMKDKHIYFKTDGDIIIQDAIIKKRWDHFLKRP